MTGHLAMYHFSPTENARQNLLREGLAASSIFITGNTVIDALLWVRDRILNNAALLATLEQRYDFLDPKKKLILVTATGGRALAMVLNAYAAPWPISPVIIPRYRWSIRCISTPRSASRLIVF